MGHSDSWSRPTGLTLPSAQTVSLVARLREVLSVAQTLWSLQSGIALWPVWYLGPKLLLHLQASLAWYLLVIVCQHAHPHAMCTHVFPVPGTVGSMICGHLFICWHFDLHTCHVHMECPSALPWKTEVEFSKEAGDQAHNMANHTDWQPIYMCLDLLIFCFCIVIPPQSTLIPQWAPHPCRQSVR